jgi:cation diffusion facilitator family transporter
LFETDISINQRNQQSTLAVNLGLAANISLAILKTSVGIFGHSPALLAEGINSTSDVAYNLVVAVFMRMSRKPPDDMHPYGHRQLESIASLIVGAFVVTTGITILWRSVDNVFDLWSGESSFQGAASLAVWIAVFTVFVKLVLGVYTRRIGLETRNPAVMALAYDHRNDVFSASGAAVGIAIGRMGYPWVDPLVGAVVALLVLRTGFMILRQSSEELMDTVPSRDLAEQITELLSRIPGIECIDEIHAHRFGPYLVINVTVGVDGGITVEDGDDIACQIETLLYQSISLLRRVYVHYHPVGRVDSFVSLHCNLEEEVK